MSMQDTDTSSLNSSILLQKGTRKHISADMPPTIQALDADVVNKIAAGEIIISPVNALKEMMENSIDAKSSAIDILVKDGGIKILQITDNGCGINKDDLPILCERFTTSKLATFEDLNKISTYGFRGEALASISHIARVTVTTKTSEDKCAWKVSYAQGKMIDVPQPIAGTNGTTILVEDLFYNMPSRLRSLRSTNEEYNKILDVVGRYAIHSSNIGFSCKKFGESRFALTVKASLSTPDRIRTVFNSSVAGNLIDFQITNPEDIPLNEVTAFISDLNYLSKKSISPIFFINNRLVTCDPLRRSLNQCYSNFLPKGSKSFIYMSILIEPSSVDVNVHPTKREVRFLHQDEIIEAISSRVQAELSRVDTSRTFKASTILTGSQSIGATSGVLRTRTSTQQSIPAAYTPASSQTTRALSSQNKVRKYENKMVRTDATQAKITSFLQSSQYDPSFNVSRSDATSLRDNDKTGSPTLNIDLDSDDDEIDESQAKEMKGDPSQSETSSLSLSGTQVMTELGSQGMNNYVVIKNKRTVVNLSSIKELREDVDMHAHKELTNVFANLNYVGIVDPSRRLVAIQHDLKLFLVDYGAICNELFYQIGLTDFSNFGKINLLTNNTDDLKLVNLLTSFDDMKAEEVGKTIETLWSMREMLDEYFSIELRDITGQDDPSQIQLVSIPLLLKGYNPSLSKLCFFIRRLGSHIDWNDEKACLRDILKQMALLYVPKIILESADAEDTAKAEQLEDIEEMSRALENVIFPCIKRRFLATDTLVKDIVEIANLPGLYKVFERC